MKQVTLELSDDLARQVGSYQGRLQELVLLGLAQLKVQEALTLYTRGIVSFARAAEIAGLSRPEMIRQARALGIQPALVRADGGRRAGMKAVTNAGPLIALGKLGLIQLLNQLFDPILVPASVYQEVVTRGLELGQPDAYAVQMAVARHDLVVVDVQIAEALTANIEPALHVGERAAIQLAGLEAADWVLLDDQLAREQAQKLGFHVKGTLGIIVDAFRRRLLATEEVELIFQAILDRDDIWISDALVRRVLDAWRRETSDR